MKKISKNIIFYIITMVAATLSSCSDSLFETVDRTMAPISDWRQTSSSSQ